MRRRFGLPTSEERERRDKEFFVDSRWRAKCVCKNLFGSFFQSLTFRWLPINNDHHHLHPHFQSPLSSSFPPGWPQLSPGRRAASARDLERSATRFRTNLADRHCCLCAVAATVASHPPPPACCSLDQFGLVGCCSKISQGTVLLFVLLQRRAAVFGRQIWSAASFEHTNTTRGERKV